jgi:hypothetical protein
VWDIEDNFEFQVKGIQNIEITSDQVKDNIDKVFYIMFKLLPPPQVLKGDTGKMFISLF